MADMRKDSTGRYPFLKSLDIGQLENLLKTDFSDSMSESASEELVDAIVEVMLEKEKENPSGRLVDVDKAWKDFQTYCHMPKYGSQHLSHDFAPSQLSPSPNAPPNCPRHFRRHLVLIAATIGIFITLLIGTQAAGVDVFGNLARWTDEVFYFISPAQAEALRSEYSATLSQALESQGLPKELTPTWFPDGFRAGVPQFWHSALVETVEVLFCHDDGRSFSFSVNRYQNPEDVWSASYEKDVTPMELYASNGRVFYIMSNLNTIWASWNDGNLVIDIGGAISVDEVKQIIDSIGG